jgi:hypothetical protein
VRAVQILFASRDWLRGFALESTGFGLYVVALALAPLTLVQSLAAGGIGILAFVSARMGGRALPRHEVVGVLVSIVGLIALAVSLAGGSGEGAGGSSPEIELWLAGTSAAAIVVVAVGRRLDAVAVSEGIAGGLFFSVGDISVKVATQGGSRAAFGLTVVAGYALGTALLQFGYRHGGALTVAGLATLLTNALPIAAGTVVLGEPVPTGALGAVRVLAFVAVTVGAILLARRSRG